MTLATDQQWFTIV